MASGRRIAAELGLPFGPFPDFLRQLKNQQILAYANSATANDYIYSLTDAGRMRAKLYFEECALRRDRAGAVRRLPRVGLGADDHDRASPGSRPAAGVLRPADLGRDLRDARPGHQLGPRDVPLRIPRQRQDQHRRADHPLLRLDGLDPQGACPWKARSSSSSTWPTTSRSRSRTPAGCSTSSTSTADGSTSGARRSSPAASCGWKTWRSTTTPTTKVSEAPLQLKSNLGTFLIDDFGRQRMQPVELLEPLDRPAGKALRLPQPGQRQEDPRAVRPADPVLDQPRAEATGGRGVPPAHPLQDQRGRPDRADVPQDDRHLRAQAGLPGGRCRRRWTT